MFLVELSPGKESIYATVADFVAAIRRGEIGWQARVYHRAKDTWLPVTLHPLFKKVAAERPPRKQWTFLPGQSGEEMASAAEPAADNDASAADPSSTKNAGARSWRRMLGGLLGSRGS